MKKIFIRALIASFCALILYMANLRRVNDAKLNIIEPKTSQVASNKKAPKKKVKEPKEPHEPKVASPEYASSTKIEKGSQKSLAKKIKQVMGKKNTYQIAVQDLNNSSRYVRMANSQRVHRVSGIMRLYLLIALYKKEQSGELGSHTAIKVKKSDRTKNEKLLQTNMAYGIAYLRDAMMHGNKTAANTLLRKVGLNYVNQIIQEFGAKQTKMLGKFTSSYVGKTTADNLDATLKGIYQGRVLNRNHAYLALGAMHGKNTKLVNQLGGATYSIGDKNSAAAIVQDQGHTYCISIWASSNHNFAQVGKTVEKWFNQHH